MLIWDTLITLYFVLMSYNKMERVRIQQIETRNLQLLREQKIAKTLKIRVTSKKSYLVIAFDNKKSLERQPLF